MNRAFIRAKQSFKSFRELVKPGHLYFWTLIASLVLFSASLAMPIWRIVPISCQQPYIPLHYNIYFGVDRFGPWYFIFIIPLLGLVFLIANTAIQTKFFRTERLLARLFAFNTVLIELILLVAMTLVILINI